MTDYIIADVILIVVMIAIFSIKKKAKSKASCCGSGTYVAESRKIKTVTEKKIVAAIEKHNYKVIAND